MSVVIGNGKERAIYFGQVVIQLKRSKSWFRARQAYLINDFQDILFDINRYQENCGQSQSQRNILKDQNPSCESKIADRS